MHDRPTKSLMENVITLMCYNDQHGKIIANLMTPDLFDGTYSLIAERAIGYWKCHSQAPKQHTPDLFDDILNGKDGRSETVRHTLVAMDVLSPDINVKYVMDSLYKLIRAQHIKQAILKSAEQIEHNQEGSIAEIETLWSQLLRSKDDTEFNPGMDLSHHAYVLDYMNSQPNEFRTGVKELDEAHIIPARGEAYLFVAPPGHGKTWFLITVGKQALLQRKKILHISLELSEEYVLQRYYQSLFTISKREQETQVTRFLKNEHEHLVGFEREFVQANLTYEDLHIREELAGNVDHFGKRAHYLVVKRFPDRSLTMDGLRVFLDQLENYIEFVPDMLILDYIGITAPTPRTTRSVSATTSRSSAASASSAISPALLLTKSIALERRRSATSARSLPATGA